MNEYVDIKGLEKLYAINMEGSVWSHISNKNLKPSINNRGYYLLCLSKNGAKKPYTLHRLLALQFLPNPLKLPFLDHINHIRTDNRLENLRWVTSRQNNNNKTNNTSHPLIYLTSCRTYRVQFVVNKQLIDFGHYKTLDEALSERDCQLDIHGLENLCYK